ncbi:MAG: hypothetical protein HOP02_11220 [Methylococcaceae bacterium]|nr:hypothetical protein [Methylococcaceae bacterium]
MSVETSNNMALPGMIAGAESKQQLITNPGIETEVFTATLKAQFQLLNAAKTDVTATTVTAPALIAELPDVNMQDATLPVDQGIDLKPAAPSVNAPIPSSNPLTDLAERASPSVAQVMPKSQVLQSLNTQLSLKNALSEDVAGQLVPPVTQATPKISLLPVVVKGAGSNSTQQQLTDIINQSPTPQTMSTLTLQSEPLQELSAVQGRLKLVAKSLDNEFDLTAILQTLKNGMLVEAVVSSNANPVDIALPQPSTAETQAQAVAAPATPSLELIATGLMPTGVFQPVISSALKSVAPKIDVRADSAKASAATLSGTILPTVNALTTLPDTAKIVDSSAQPIFLTEVNSNNPAYNSSAIADVSTGTLKQTFAATLENLNLNAPNVAALDTGIAKSLSGLAAELSAFDRPTPMTGKGDVSPMSAHLYSPEWNKELGTKIVWMTSQNVSSAELTLNPKHLGPISIHIDMQQDQANIAFTAQNAGVKEILEASIPKLREMMQAQQLNLAEVNVSQQSFSEQGQANSPFFGAGEGQKRNASGLDTVSDPNAPVIEGEEQNAASQTLVTNGLVSVYA